MSDSGLPIAEFFIVSVKHTPRANPRRPNGRYITFWRPDDAGYCWPLSWAGRYSASRVAEDRNYYNCGEAAIAVPCDAVLALAVPPTPGDIDNDAGPVVRNTAANWRALKASARV